MLRIGRFGRLKPGAADEYFRLHNTMDPVLNEAISRAGIRNFSIYIHGDDLFSYLECDDWDAALEYLANDPPTQEWSRLMGTLLGEPLPWQILEEVFHVD